MKIDRDAPIGVFDSGVGGLTVAREIMRNLPSEKIVYFGDTARVPYGSKSKETIIRYSRQIIHFLREQQVKAIVIACNTASAFALDAVKDELDIPVLGVIEAGARVAAEETHNKRVGVIGTLGTVGSGIHEAFLKHLDPEITVIGKACPLFVPLVEEGWLHDPVTTEVASRYLKELKQQEKELLENAYTGFETAFSKESFPMCGMDEITVSYLLAELARRIGKFEESSRWISRVLISRDANDRIKNRAREIKELLNKDMHKA